MRIALLAAGLVSGLLVSLPLSAPAAAPSAHRDTDTRRDVVQTPRAGYRPCTTCQGVDFPAADILRTKDRYAAALVLSTRVRELRPGVIFSWRINVDGANYVAAAVRRKGNLSFRFFQELKAITCEGLTGAAAAKKPEVSVTVPPACLGDPAQVRVGAMVIVSTRASVYLDDARRNRFKPGSVLNAALGPSLVRSAAR